MAHSARERERLTHLRDGHFKKASNLFLGTNSALNAYFGRQAFAASSSTTRVGDATTGHCRSCGTTLLPSYTCSRVRSQGGDSKSSGYKCNACGTLSSRPKRARVSRTLRTTTTTTPAVTSQERVSQEIKSTALPLTAVTSINDASRDDPPTSTASAAPKKRSRTKKASGLSGLVAQSKSQQQKPSGFDLMDFMTAG